MLDSRVRDHVQTSLRGIATKAKHDRKYRFCDIYRLINRVTLMDAWYDLNKKSICGVDNITAQDYEKNLLDNILSLEKRLKEKRYKTKLVLRVYIPKSKDKLRPLGIPVLEDKLVQLAAVKILNAIYEQDFLSCSYGYRPGRSPAGAVKDITANLMKGRFSYIVDADIAGFFDNMNHDWLIKMLKQRIKDKAFINLVRKWLKAGILDDGKLLRPEKGTPQGGSVSPVLSNIYLHYALDLWVTKVIKPQSRGQVYLCRFADDFVCAFQYKNEAERFYKELDNRLKKFNLELSKEKTKIIGFSRFRKEQPKTSFEFLGFEIRWGTSRKGFDVIKRRTSRKKLRQSILNYKEWIKKHRDKRINRILSKLRLKLLGYYNYYGIIGNIKSLATYYSRIKMLTFKWLNRRSQRRSFNYKGFEEMWKHFNVPLPRIVEKESWSSTFWLA